jgi:hypothetical protein
MVASVDRLVSDVFDAHAYPPSTAPATAADALVAAHAAPVAAGGGSGGGGGESDHPTDELFSRSPAASLQFLRPMIAFGVVYSLTVIPLMLVVLGRTWAAPVCATLRLWVALHLALQTVQLPFRLILHTRLRAVAMLHDEQAARRLLHLSRSPLWCAPSLARARSPPGRLSRDGPTGSRANRRPRPSLRRCAARSLPHHPALTCPRARRYGNRALGFLNCVWFLIGVFWLWTGQQCAASAPGLHLLSVGVFTVNPIRYVYARPRPLLRRRSRLARASAQARTRRHARSRARSSLAFRRRPSPPARSVTFFWFCYTFSCEAVGGIASPARRGASETLIRRMRVFQYGRSHAAAAAAAARDAGEAGAASASAPAAVVAAAAAAAAAALLAALSPPSAPPSARLSPSGSAPRSPLDRGAGAGAAGAVAQHSPCQQLCVICLCEFEVGDRLMSLPCAHAFHCACISKWLRRAKTCPLCQQPLDAPPAQPATDAPPARPPAQPVQQQVDAPDGVRAPLLSHGRAEGAGEHDEPRDGAMRRQASDEPRHAAERPRRRWPER